MNDEERYIWLQNKADELERMDGLEWSVGLNIAVILLLHRIMKEKRNNRDNL